MSMLKEDFVIDTKGKKKAVIFSIKKYEQLMEDLHDLAIVAERRKEEVVAFEDMKRRLKKNGVL
jgi:PHD/YefM family antitoxin component YafN of YafNO toxin-antitoxin module